MKARIPFQMTSAQRKAMNEEINRQILEHDEAFAMDSDATVLWILHTEFGFGAKRLRRFWNSYFRQHQELREYYQFDVDEVGWLCRYKLKQIGVDIEKWYKENNGNSKR